jgi:hypothetical protein
VGIGTERLLKEEQSTPELDAAEMEILVETISLIVVN